jgi:hypothetical protein
MLLKKSSKRQKNRDKFYRSCAKIKKEREKKKENKHSSLLNQR